MPDTFEKSKEQMKAFIKQGYTLVGLASFTGLQDGPEAIKKFAASIGADLVLSDVLLVGTSTQSYMGIESFTPGSSITSFGTASAYSTGSGSGSLSTPYGPMSYNSQSYGSGYGTATSTTYVPAQVTYAPRYYEVPVTRQLYGFYLSPQGYLRNWRQEWSKLNSNKSASSQGDEEEMKKNAMAFAQSWNLILPNDLMPKTQLLELSPAAKKINREHWISRVSEPDKAP